MKFLVIILIFLGLSISVYAKTNTEEYSAATPDFEALEGSSSLQASSPVHERAQESCGNCHSLESLDKNSNTGNYATINGATAQPGSGDGEN